MVTISDVAKLAGVSVATASMALNNKKRVSPKTRQKVLSAAKTLGYIPNNLAKSLTTKRTGVIGVFMAEIVNPYHSMLIHYIQKGLYRRGYRMNLGITGGSTKLEEEVLRDFIAQKVDGVLIHTTDIIDFKFSTFYELIRRKIPTVLVGEKIEGIEFSAVEVNLEKGSYELTQYLINRGYKRFLFLTGQKSAITFKRRIEAFYKAMAQNGYPVWESDIIETHPNIEGGYKFALECMTRNRNLYDVIMCVNDYMAFGVLEALQELGIRVPDEIGVVGFDDIPFASLAFIPLTTVRIPIEELAQKSVEMFCSQLDFAGTEVGNIYYELVDTEIVVRQSTR